MERPDRGPYGSADAGGPGRRRRGHGGHGERLVGPHVVHGHAGSPLRDAKVGRAGRGRRQRHPEHLGGEGRREEGDRVRVHGDGGARAAARRGERPRKYCRRAPERRRGVGFRKGVGGYHHQRVDGLFLAAGVDARLRDLRAGSLHEAGGRAVPVAREDVLVPRGAARR